jgi:YD repeat-containing protein
VRPSGGAWRNDRPKAGLRSARRLGRAGRRWSPLMSWFAPGLELTPVPQEMQPRQAYENRGILYLDHLGSVISLGDSNGEVTGFTCDAFGNVTGQLGNATNELKFTGAPMDSNGLVHWAPGSTSLPWAGSSRRTSQPPGTVSNPPELLLSEILTARSRVDRWRWYPWSPGIFVSTQ